MKALILAGGKGTRFLEETKVRPKPMIEINNKPILLHIIDQYRRHGINEFIVLGGYKIEYIYEYFEEQKLNDDNEYLYQDTKIKILDTGIETMTGGRIKRAQEFLDDTFLVTYGDGISNINLSSSSLVFPFFKYLVSPSKVNKVGIGPPFGISCEYKCQSF